MQAHILRNKFLDFFKSKKHKVVDSDSLIPKGDPTVLFTPAGMNQFKRELLGFDSGFKRAATAQRCLRTDDLDKVGHTIGHHTFFEMLGNFSFGDYFKKEAISWAWEFLTKELMIDKEKLWVSVYKGDDEAYGVWRDIIKVPKERIVRLGDKENFWPSEAKTKGPNGPCGPCSEIFVDQGVDAGCKSGHCDPGCDCGRFLEVWNLVFTQYNRKEGGALEPLPNKNIDTGMGLERLAAVMQNAPNNFETDLFKPIIKEITAGLKSPAPSEELVYAIADHIRAIVFAIYDGALPSNEARGYIVRKLIRKSALHLRFLGKKDPLLYKLVVPLASVMKPYYPELEDRRENIAQVILAEEKSFANTLNTSDKLFKEQFSRFKNNSDPINDPIKVGRIAFRLYDTNGIPLDLTLEWLQRNGIKISREAFDRELTEQKNRSKARSAMKGDVFSMQDVNPGKIKTRFFGYKKCSVKAKIIKVIKDNTEAKKISKGDEAQIVLDKTSFYAESGGQVADTGRITKGKNIFEVLDTRKSGKAIIHIGKVKEGTFKVKDLVLAEVNSGRRMAIARNHTATHLLQAALRKVLGAHVRQQGSLVAEDRLRFDFTHFKGLDKNELNRIEETVNQFILGNLAVKSKEQTLALAKKSGALAFFGEKYSDKVRVIDVAGISKEFCGGTHLDSTGQIGLFKILQEGSVASGIRRIEATTGTFAYKKIKEEEGALDDIASVLNVPQDRLAEEAEKRSRRLKDLEKELAGKKIDTVKVSLDKLIAGAQIKEDVKIITAVFEDMSMDLLRKNIDLLKEKTTNAIIALGANNQGMALLVIGITQDLCAKGWDASKIIRDISGVIGGSGGGRPDFAQAGGNEPQNLNQALDKLKEII